MSNVLWVYMTASDRDEADRIATALVEERLAACVNLLDGMRSVYRWQGRVERATETVLIAKTRAERFEALRRRVCELHSYDTPCIEAWPVAHGHPPFLAWVVAETAP